MPKNRPLPKSLGKIQRNNPQIINTTKSRMQQQTLPIKSALKGVNLNECMMTVADLVPQRCEESADYNNVCISRPSSAPPSVIQSNYNVLTMSANSSMSDTIQRRKRVKFSDVVQAFSIGDGWKMSTFVEKLKTEVDQQDRSRQLRDNYRQYMTKFNPLSKGL